MHLRAQYTFAFLKHACFSIFAVLCVLTLAAGCEQERNVGNKPKQQSQAASSATPKPEFIVGRRTQEIKNAATEIKQEGATVATTRITAKDPITLPGNAYVTAIGRMSILKIQQAVDLYHAEHDRYPKDYQEFMDEIIKANNIALPVLPSYQKYGYDENEHKLVILEDEDLKNRPLGR